MNNESIGPRPPPPLTALSSEPRTTNRETRQDGNTYDLGQLRTLQRTVFFCGAHADPVIGAHSITYSSRPDRSYTTWRTVCASGGGRESGFFASTQQHAELTREGEARRMDGHCNALHAGLKLRRERLFDSSALLPC